MRGKDCNGDVETEPFALRDGLEKKLYTSTTEIDSSTQEEEELPSYEMLEEIGFGRYQIYHILIVGMIIGGDAGQVFLLSIIHPDLVCMWKLSSMQVAMMSVTFMLFYMIGSFAGGFLSDVIGRKKTLIFSGIFLVVFELVVPAAGGYIAFLFVYGVTGIFVGCRYSVSVTLLSEISPINRRSVSVFSIKLFWALGGMFETLVSLIVLQKYGHKYLCFITAIVGILSLLLTLLLNESPRWLLANGHFSQALKVIRRAGAQNKCKKYEAKANVVAETAPSRPVDSIHIIKEKERSGLGVLFLPEYRLATLAMAFIMFACTALYFSLLYLNTSLHIINYCGVGSENTHMSDLQKECQVLEDGDYVDLLVTCVIEVPALALAIGVTEYLGRLIAFKVFCALASISLFFLILCITSVNTEIQLFVSRGIVDGLLLAIWIYVPEIYPTRVRNIAVGMINTAGKLGAVLGILSVQMLSLKHPHVIITIGFLISFMAFATMFTLKKETKGQPLNEMNS